MILFSACKLNLGLRIVAKRADSYHNIQSIFYPFPLFDILELHEADSFTYEQQGFTIEGRMEDNLCYKTWHYFSRFYGIPPLKIYHQKSVPIGAGLGGGSANVASLIKFFNQQFTLGLSMQNLMQIAANISADSPFFLQDSPALVSGLGEEIEPMDFAIPKDYLIILCIPRNLRISTAEIFRQIKPQKQDIKQLRNLSIESIADWRNILVNDFEDIVFPQYPRLAQIKAQLYVDGAIFASMTGTGAGIYGIFPNKVQININKYPQINIYTSDYKYNCIP